MQKSEKKKFESLRRLDALRSTVDKTHPEIVAHKRTLKVKGINPLLDPPGWKGDDIDKLLEEVYALRSIVIS